MLNEDRAERKAVDKMVQLSSVMSKCSKHAVKNTSDILGAAATVCVYMSLVYCCCQAIKRRLSLRL